MTASKQTLDYLSREQRDLEAQLDAILCAGDGEITEQNAPRIAELEAWIGDLRAQGLDRINALCERIERLEALAKAKQERAVALSEWGASLYAKARWLRGELFRQCEAQGVDRLQTTDYKLGVYTASSAPVVVDSAEALPVDLLKTVPPVPDKTKIGQRLKEGQEVPGCRLGEKSRYLRIW